MSTEPKDSKGVIIAQATKAMVNSKATKKLADAVGGFMQLPQNVFEHIVGPERIIAIGKAKAEVAVVEAKAKSEIDVIKAEAADYLRTHEMRKAVHRRAILAEAQKALPPPDQTVSDEVVSEDFIHQFFDEFDGISDPEVHKIVGRLLANEVVHPGSFPRRTMRVLKDLESSNFAVFSSLCRFNWNFGFPVPVIFETSDEIYKKNGINFSQLSELETLGLISFGQIAGYEKQEMPTLSHFTYDDHLVEFWLKEGVTKLALGMVLLTDSGRRLAPLTCSTPVPDFLEYAIGKWQNDGHQIKIVGSLKELAASQSLHSRSKSA